MPETPATKVNVVDWVRPETMLSTTVAGPAIASISYALTTNLAIPSGYSLLFTSLVFAALVPLVHKNVNLVRKLSIFTASALILFSQAAGSSTLLAHSSDELREHAMCHGVGVGDILIPQTFAIEMPNPLCTYTVEEKDGNYIVTPSEGEVSRVPIPVYEAIAEYRRLERRDVKQTSPWRIRFSK